MEGVYFLQNLYAALPPFLAGRRKIIGNYGHITHTNVLQKVEQTFPNPKGSQQINRIP